MTICMAFLKYEEKAVVRYSQLMLLMQNNQNKRMKKFNSPKDSEECWQPSCNLDFSWSYPITHFNCCLNWAIVKKKFHNTFKHVMVLSFSFSHYDTPEGSWMGKISTIKSGFYLQFAKRFYFSALDSVLVNKKFKSMISF